MPISKESKFALAKKINDIGTQINKVNREIAKIEKTLNKLKGVRDYLMESKSNITSDMQGDK